MSQHGLLQRSTPKRRYGEMMGGATAECTAVVCCCPFAVMDMLVLALYKAPRGMCRKAIEKKKKRRNRKRKEIGKDGVGLEDSLGFGKLELDEIVRGREMEGIVEDVDLEMICGNGFWRSDSQRSSGL